MTKLVAIIVCSLIIGGISQAADPNETGSPDPGRYQIVLSPLARADTFLLDTHTGRVWQRSQFSELNGEPSAWVPMDKLDDHDQIMTWAMAKGLKPSMQLTPAPSRQGNLPLKHK
jgi:hypothetical protein